MRNPFSKVDVSAGYCFLLSFSGLLLQHCRVSGNKLLQHFCHQTGGWKIPSTRSTYRQDIAFFCRSPVCSGSTAAYPATSCCSTSITRLAGGKSLQQGRGSAGYCFLLSFSGPLSQHCRVSGNKLLQHFHHQTGGWKIPSTRSTYRQDISFFCRSPVRSHSTAAYPATSCRSTSATRLAAGEKSLQQGRRIGRVLLSSVVLRSALAALPRIRQQAVAALLSPDWQVENPVNKVDVSAGYCFLPSFPGLLWQHCHVSDNKLLQHFCHQTGGWKSRQQGRGSAGYFFLPSPSGLLWQHCHVSDNKLLQHFYHQTGGWKIPSTRSTYRQDIAFFRRCSGPLSQHCRVSGNKLLQHFCHQTGGWKIPSTRSMIGRILLSSVVLRSALAALPRIRQQAVAALLPPDRRVENPFSKVDVSAGYCFLPSLSGLLLQHCRVSGNKLLQHFYHLTGGWKIPSTRSTIGRIFLSAVTPRSALAALPRIRQQAVAALPPPDRG